MADIEHLGREFMHTQDVQIRTEYVPKPPWMKKGLAMLLGIIFAFILGEVALRVMGYNAAEQKKNTDIRTGLRVYQPDASIAYRNECLTNTIETNSLGFHSAEYDLVKPAGTFRIAVVGDSFVEAAQVPVAKMFTSILESRLTSTRGRRFEVIPFGISGNASYANLQYLKAYGLQFKPDLVIDAFFSNDVLADFYRPDNPSAAAPHDDDLNLLPDRKFEAQGWDASMKNYVKSLIKKSNIVVLLYSKFLNWRTIRNGRPAPEVQEKSLSIDSEIYLADVPEFWQRAWKLQESIFKAFVDVNRDNDAQFLLLALPEAQRTHPDLSKEFTASIPQGTKIDLEMPDRQLRQIAGRNGINLMAAQPYFTARAAREPSATTYWACDGHFNETGHQWMADALYDFLIRSNLLR